MGRCVICGKETTSENKRTCSKECYKIFMRLIVSKKFLNQSFKKGNIPFNKGLKQKEWMSDAKIKKCSKTYIQHQKSAVSKFSSLENRFLPHNTKAKGTIVKRAHIYNKGKNKGKIDYEYYINIDWKGNRKPNNLLKKYIWEYYHQQDIPKGYIVHFIDGNTENFDISNLEILTRGQLMLLNSRNKK